MNKLIAVMENSLFKECSSKCEREKTMSRNFPNSGRNPSLQHADQKDRRASGCRTPTTSPIHENGHEGDGGEEEEDIVDVIGNSEEANCAVKVNTKSLPLKKGAISPNALNGAQNKKCPAQNTSSSSLPPVFPVVTPASSCTTDYVWTFPTASYSISSNGTNVLKKVGFVETSNFCMQWFCINHQRLILYTQMMQICNNFFRKRRSLF